MSRGNPRKAMAALLPLPIRCGSESLVVRPMTLGLWAALERIESPMVTGREPKDTLELLPSLYLLTHDPREVYRGNLVDLAMQWADTVGVDALEAIQAACYRQMNAAFDVMPEAEAKKGKGAGMTAGCPRSCTGQPQHTTGVSKTSSGACRSPRSSCYAGAKRLTIKGK